MDEFRDSQKERIKEALDMCELTTGRGLNEELGLSRACDTRWGSHYKSFNNFILMFGSIVNVLQSLVHDARLMDERAKHDILVPNFKEPYVSSLRSRRRLGDNTVSHHYRVEVFCNIIDCFHIRKIMKKVVLYPDDFDEFNISVFENQLASYIIDVRDVDESFFGLKGLCALPKRLVQTKKHSNYPFVFRLVKLGLLLPVATASVERAFSTMKFIKNDLWSQISDDIFSGCLVPYLEKDVFDNISNDASIKTFQEMKPRRVQL
ncbi:uncharacterized protein LOC132034599 [Lycium ferocissimum]|uniref:uncharacterized protein LOC132034599 n=1 Tax=Lycium ferocissimum TaxID=112874 RepID=UPI0028154847|nr:uncharacterized protein LOC132034599 [Lycium ferocissimum]